MTKIEILNQIKNDEFEGEKLINKFRFPIALIYAINVPVVSIMNGLETGNYYPPRAYIFSNVFLCYSVFLIFYLRSRKEVHNMFKYICVVLDILIITASFLVGCTYMELAPPIPFLSIWALFYSVIIMLGAFRYSVRCAIFSGFFAGFIYIIAVIINADKLDLPYFFYLGDQIINVSFPIFNEVFRVIAMIITGFITGIACKRHFALFNNMLDTHSKSAQVIMETVEQTRSMAEIIQKSTDDIFLSSKNIFSTANNQAASIQEIESTINENSNIAAEISEKTSSVATIAMKMENDVISGFSVLERNVNQLKDIKSKNDNVISGIITLGNKILKIRDIVRNINTITDQTKVIAFNAALEAASAGDRGKRFAVVANEVNRLADDIASLTNQIREQVLEIQNSSSSLIISSEESADKISEGNNLIKELEEIFRQIRSGAEITANQAQTITTSTNKQQQSTEQINLAITDISKGLSNFIHSTKVATSSAEDLTKMIHELGSLLTINNTKPTTEEPGANCETDNKNTGALWQ